MVVKNKRQLVELFTKVLVENLESLRSTLFTEVYDYGIEIPFNIAIEVLEEYWNKLVDAIVRIKEELEEYYSKLEDKQ